MSTSNTNMDIDYSHNPEDQDNQNNYDEQDEVLEEIDVIFNNTNTNTNNKLLVLQFPLRPANKSYSEQGNIDKAEINSSKTSIKLEYSNYNSTNTTNILNNSLNPLKYYDSPRKPHIFTRKLYRNQY